MPFEPEPLRQNYPGETLTRTMTTHPDHGQDVPMATTADGLVDSVSPLASRDSELTARFVNDAPASVASSQLGYRSITARA